MKAQTGRTYAQILNGRCHWVFTEAELPEWNETQIATVDVTGNVPNEGDLWDGVSFTAPPAPPAPILTCTRRQFKQALTAAGIRAAAEAYVATGDQDLKDWYNDSMTFEEDHPQIIAAQATLGLSDAERHALFQLARTL